MRLDVERIKGEMVLQNILYTSLGHIQVCMKELNDRERQRQQEQHSHTKSRRGLLLLLFFFFYFRVRSVD